MFFFRQSQDAQVERHELATLSSTSSNSSPTAAEKDSLVLCLILSEIYCIFTLVNVCCWSFQI